MKNSNETALSHKQVQDTEKIIPLKTYDLTDFEKFLSDWKRDFINRMRSESKSRKRNFTYYDAVTCTSFINNPLDKKLIEYFKYVMKKPLQKNDYFKYVNTYINTGKKLDEAYFRHDERKLHEYYEKIDRDKERPYKVFNETAWRKYVLFMMLKFSGLYSKNYDDMFNVKTVDHREYNPLTNLPSVFRSILPFKIKEYDISRAFPSFIFMELGIEPFDVYELIEKPKFNMLLNVHKETENANIEKVRNQLRPLYNDRVNEVITDKRFNNKGQTFRDFSMYEEEYIKKFIEANNPKYYVRLHDSVTVLGSENCQILTFDKYINFKQKEFPKSEIRQGAKSLFYEFDPEGFCVIRPSLVSDFFIQEGFIRISKPEYDELTIIKNENKILSPFNIDSDTDSFLMRRINEEDPNPVKDAITNQTNKIRNSFKLLPAEEWKLQKDTKDSVFLPFKNGVLKVTKDETELIPYESDEIRFFMKTESMNHDFERLPDDKEFPDFGKFLSSAIIGRMVTPNEWTINEIKRIRAFYSMFGYLISNYKNPSLCPAIILSDQGANDSERRGRRGKTLITKGIEKFRLSKEKGGNEFNGNYIHNLADLDEYHDLYIIDDIPANFKYDDLYTNISGSISPQRKGTKAELIPFEMTPKFVITTNWSVRHDPEADSTNARFIEYQLTDYWNISHTPKDHFEYNFFDEWNPEQWNEFFNFIVDCVQIFLKFGLESIQYDKRTDNYNAYFYNDAKTEEFERIFEMIRGYSGGFNVSDFLTIYNDPNNALRFERYFTSKNLKKHIDAYIRYKNLNLEYRKDLRRWKEVKNDEKDEEINF